MNEILNDTTNYLVPASGKTHSVTFEGIFLATPLTIDWRQFSVDNYRFQPQGIFIDNILGIADLVVTILPIKYKVICPAGVAGQFQFPAPDNQTCTITGSGQATVVFVDFPVLPNNGLINIGNTVNVKVTDFVNKAATVFVDDTITGAVVLATIVPAANSKLKKLNLSMSGDVTLAVAGITTLTVALNGLTIYRENYYISAVISAFKIVDRELDFSDFDLNSGPAGTLDITLSTALATGNLDINAYFTL